MSLDFNQRFTKFKKNYKKYLSDSTSEAKEIKNHKLDLIEINVFIYNLEFTEDEISKILDIEIDSSTISAEDIMEEENNEETELTLIINLLKYRANLFKDNYPFIVTSSNSIKLKEQLTINNKNYLVLLCSSNLNRFREFTTPLTNDFEKLSAYSINNIFGDNAKLVEFGNNSDYKGLNSRSKLRKLAKEMNIEVEDDRIEKIPKKANKDKGSDLVTWIPFNDKKPIMFMMFIQCASGRNWKNKLSENRQINSYFKLGNCVTSYGVTVPFEFTTTDKEFEYFENIENTDNILFDRSRLLEYNNKDETVIDSIKMIDKIIESKFKYN